jgi:4-hydroxythreonine-4-phosphate dehydrogenase
MRRPIGLTMGDPAGIGPEIIRQALARREVRARGPFVLFGEARLFPRLPRGVEFRPAGEAPGRARWTAGRMAAAAGRAAHGAVVAAVEAALRRELAAVVTAPISKEAWARAGLPYPGQTELLEELCRRRSGARCRAVMLMVGGGLRVGLATIHVALRDVPRLLSAARIVAVGRVMDAALRADFGLRKPRLAVLALNPHASDGGRFGDEEERIVRPAVARLRAAGVVAAGPLPADVAFHRARAGEFDGVLALYHDQGCIPVKTLAFASGVNCTIGLPIVRTSPDHGTAFELAGRGVADDGSLVAAIRLAAEIAARRGLRQA